MWIARDPNNSLWLFGNKPYQSRTAETLNEWFSSFRIGELDFELFPKITVKNSPQKVTLVRSL